MSVDIIVCTYGPNGQKYLDDCLLSIQKQTYKDKKVYVISSGEFKPEINCSMDIVHKHYHSRMHFPEAVNEGVKLGTGSHILLCNDDIILQKQCLERLISHIDQDPKLILNPISPCDNNRFYYLPMAFNYEGKTGFFEQNQYKHDDIYPKYVSDIIESGGLFPSPIKGRLQLQFAAFYCTLMTRNTWKEVGGIDTTLRTGQDDLDFALRAKDIGIKCAATLDAFCFHYSGATADIHLSKSDRMFNIDHFNKKWSHKGIFLEQLK